MPTTVVEGTRSEIDIGRRAFERDRGSMLALVCLVVVGVVAAVTLALLPLAVDLTHRQQAQSAADAAALAGVTGGRSASADLAAANGASVTSWIRDGRAVTVTVRVGAVSATARATDEP